MYDDKSPNPEAQIEFRFADRIEDADYGDMILAYVKAEHLALEGAARVIEHLSPDVFSDQTTLDQLREDSAVLVGRRLALSNLMQIFGVEAFNPAE